MRGREGACACVCVCWHSGALRLIRVPAARPCGRSIRCGPCGRSPVSTAPHRAMLGRPLGRAAGLYRGLPGRQQPARPARDRRCPQPVSAGRSSGGDSDLVAVTRSGGRDRDSFGKSIRQQAHSNWRRSECCGLLSACAYRQCQRRPLQAVEVSRGRPTPKRHTCPDVQTVHMYRQFIRTRAYGHGHRFSCPYGHTDPCRQHGLWPLTSVPPSITAP